MGFENALSIRSAPVPEYRVSVEHGRNRHEHGGGPRGVLDGRRDSGIRAQRDFREDEIVAVRPGGFAYFDRMLPTLGLITNGKPLGQKASFFCLENEFWRIIALDTGYNSVGLSNTFFNRAAPLAIYDEFGVRDGIRAFGRCIGHGGMPVDLSPAMPKHSQCVVEFTDKRDYPNDENLKIGFNGFAQLSMQGNRMTVRYVDVRGTVIFSEVWVAKNGILERIQHQCG